MNKKKKEIVGKHSKRSEKNNIKKLYKTQIGKKMR